MRAAVDDFWRLTRALLLRTVIHEPQADAAESLSDSVAAHWHLRSYGCKLLRGASRMLKRSQLGVQMPLASMNFRFRQKCTYPMRRYFGRTKHCPRRRCALQAIPAADR